MQRRDCSNAGQVLCRRVIDKVTARPTVPIADALPRL